MGAHASCCFAGLAAAGVAANMVGKKRAALADSYDLGDELSRGTFGAVHACVRRSTGSTYAVKRIPKRPNALASIDLEVALLLRLAHPLVVELHEVYPGLDTVDLVFTAYPGGDVTAAARRHWAAGGGDLAMRAVQNLTQQMFRAIEWLHSNGVVHRDVKGDNCLLDRPSPSDPACRLVLADLGAAAQIRPGERLEAPCGTPQYWAPEIYARSYGPKVDVWAGGMVAYCLVARQFPFASPEQARAARGVQIPSRCGAAAGDFMLGALAPLEEDRLSAAAALEHPFLLALFLLDAAAASLGEAPSSLPCVVPDHATACGGQSPSIQAAPTPTTTAESLPADEVRSSSSSSSDPLEL